MTSIILGIGGASASGKTDFACAIKNILDIKEVSIIKLDDYYKDFPDLSLEERKKINYDSPDAFDYDLLIEHLKMLKKGGEIKCPIYNYSDYSRSANSKIIGNSEIYILEGILIFNNAELRKLIDIKLFIDTPLDLCLFRRINRDIISRNRTLESIGHQYENFVRPMYYEHIEPYKSYANIIIPKKDRNEVGTTVIIHAIKQLIKNVKQDESFYY